MNTMNSRKALHDKTWGNFRYDAESDTLWWKDEDDALWQKDDNGELRIKYKNGPPYRPPYPIDHTHDTIEGALYWISHMEGKKRKMKEQDLKDLAQAFSELIGCPIIADAYRTSYRNRKVFMRIARSEGSVCEQCIKRYQCFTQLTDEIPERSS